MQPFRWSRQVTKQVFSAGKVYRNIEIKSKRRWVGKRTSSSVGRERRTAAKKRRRKPKKHHMASTNSTEGTTNSKKKARKRSRSAGRVQKKARQGHAHRRQGAWTDIKPEQQTILRKRSTKKIRKVITSSWRRTLLGEVAAKEKKARREHARKGRVTWPGMQQY